MNWLGKNRKIIILLVFISLFFLFFSFYPIRSYAQSAFSYYGGPYVTTTPLSFKTTFGDILARALAWILYYIAMGLGWVFSLVAAVMLKIATYNNFLNEKAVLEGWKILRDICNNFFIILLIITAISTMLRQGEFKDWRSILPKILVAAVLINFSLLMCGIFIDISQVFTLTFASPLNSNVSYNIILAAMDIPSTMQLEKFANNKIDNEQRIIDITDLIAPLFYAIIITLVALVVTIAITVILSFRIVWLWFLIILSPLPFILSIFKQGASYAQEWGKEFSKYLIVGPVIMFFLYISFLAMSGMGNNTILQGINSDKQYIQENQEIINKVSALSNAGTPDGVIRFVIVIGLLVGSLIMGRKMGVAGSNFAGQSLNWLQKQGKRWSGYNLATSTGKSALSFTFKKAPLSLLTAADDKLGMRQKLYSGAFNWGGNRIPFVNQWLGKKVWSKEEATQQRINAKYDALAKGYKVDSMNEIQLRELANKGGARSVVAVQALMKKGLIKDNDIANRKDNIKIIQQARQALAGTNLGGVFDDNLKKTNPSLAYSTIYQNNHKKLVEDLETGKINLNNLMSNLIPEQIEALKKNLGGENGAIAKFLLQYSDDIGRTLNSMNKESRNLITKEINHEIFANNDEARNKYLSSRPTDIMKVFDLENPQELEKARVRFSNNREFLLKTMDISDMNKEFIEQFGDLFTSKELENNFANRSFQHKDAAIKALQEHLDDVLKEVDFSQLAQQIKDLEIKAAANNITEDDKKTLDNNLRIQETIDEIIRKNLYMRGSLSKEFDNKSGSNEALARVIKSLNVDAAARIKWSSLTNNQQAIIANNLSQNVLKALTRRGDNDELVGGVQSIQNRIIITP